MVNKLITVDWVDHESFHSRLQHNLNVCLPIVKQVNTTHILMRNIVIFNILLLHILHYREHYAMEWKRFL